MKNMTFINLKNLRIYIFKIQIVKMIIVLVYFKDRSSRMPIYVWDELYFFKGSYSIRIMQWSRKVIHRKRLFKEINMLLQERLTFKDTVWRTDKEKIVSWPSREQIFTRLSDRYAENIVRLTLFFPVRSDIFRYVC